MAGVVSLVLAFAMGLLGAVGNPSDKAVESKLPQLGDIRQDLVSELVRISDSGKIPTLCDWISNKSLGQNLEIGEGLVGQIPGDLYGELRRRITESPQSLGYKIVFFACQLSEDKYERLDRKDKLVCQCAGLKSAAMEDLPNGCPLKSDAFLHECFQRFGAALAGMNLADADPYLDDLVMISSELAVSHPDLGPSLGKYLGGVLAQARAVAGRDHSEQGSRRAAVVSQQREMRQRLVLDLDPGNLVATAHFCIAHMLICNAANAGDALMADDLLTRIKDLNEHKTDIRTHLRTGASLLKDKSMVWLPFKLYSDELLGLYEAAENERGEVRNQRDDLIIRSAAVLYEGIRTYLQVANRGLNPREDLKDARKELYYRVSKYASQLQREMRLPEFICFASKYVDTPGVLEDEDAQKVHMLLAEIDYALDLPYEYHLDRCNGLINMSQLAAYKDSWITSEKMKPCHEIDW